MSQMFVRRGACATARATAYAAARVTAHATARAAAYATALVGCALLLFASGCGGGGTTVAAGTGSGSTPPAAAGNVVSVVVDDGPTAATGVVNTPYVSVTICVHGTATCQTIDHITVDTGSTGLRIVSSVLSASVATGLAQVTDTQGRPLVECLQFADGYSWGPVKLADAQIGGEQASNIAVELIGDASFPTVPADCSGSGPEEDTVAEFGANGILGIGVFRQDCGPGCATTAFPGMYYGCSTSGCVSTTVAVASQVSNPVFLFPTDNNGSILELPAVGATGAATLTGSLVFGIDTESNNALGTAAVLTVSPDTGLFSANFSNQSLSDSIVDSGSNGYFFTDGTTTVCTSKVASDFYCPASTQSLNATIVSATGITSNVTLSVANADSLFNGNPTFAAFSNLGGTNPDSSSFDFGLPFFMGRHVYTAIESQNTSAGPGPYIGF